MNRRDFIVRLGGTFIAVPVFLEAISCDDPNAPTDQWDQTSQADGTGHQHIVTVFCRDLTSTTQIVYTSTSAVGHAHTVTLGLSQLSGLSAGQPVSVQSEIADGHNHAWSFKLPANHC